MKVLVTGATGFIGSRVAQQLVGRRHEVRCLVRGTSDLRSLQMLPVEIWRGDIFDPASLRGAMEEVAFVVHLVGIIKERGPEQSFQRVHVEGTSNVLAAAKEAGVAGLLFMSAVGVAPDQRYPYLFSKWQAEEAVKSSGLGWTVLRSSTVFGEGDEFMSRLAAVVRRPPMGGVHFSPVVPVIGSGATRFQPVWVEDVAQCVAKAAEDGSLRGRTLEVGGPEQYSYDQLVDAVMDATGVHRPRLHTPVFLVRPAISLMERLLPDPPLTSAQLAMLEIDNVPRENAIQSVFGIAPARLTDKLGYLRPERDV